MNCKEMAIWALGLMLLAGVAISPVACTMQQDALVADAIKGGADPISARCALDGMNGTSPLCMARAARP